MSDVDEMAGMRAEARELRAEIERLRRDCAELYQVIGALAADEDLWGDLQVQKALDNASAAADGRPRPHDDLLPFTAGEQEKVVFRAEPHHLDECQFGIMLEQIKALLVGAHASVSGFSSNAGGGSGPPER